MSYFSFIERLQSNNLAANPTASVRDIVVADLNKLLNTRLFRHSRLYYAFNEFSAEKSLELTSNIEQSVYNYGMPDFTYISFESEDSLSTLSSVIRSIILANDSRFKYIKVDIVSDNNQFERVLNLRIHAEIHIEQQLLDLELDSKIYCREHGFSFQDFHYG